MDHENDESKLTDRQQMFIAHYRTSLNASQAAICAGYSPASARQIGQRLLTNVVIRSAIHKGMKRLEEATELDEKTVMKNLQELYARCMEPQPVIRYNPLLRRKIHVKDMNGDLMYKFNSRGALRALELMGKHLGMFH